MHQSQKGIGWLPYFLPAVVFKASKAIVKQGGESKDVDVQQPQHRCSVDVVLRRSHIFKPVQIAVQRPSAMPASTSTCTLSSSLLV